MTPQTTDKLIRPGDEGDRTQRILRGVANGFLSREIAHTEEISKTTVDRERVRAHRITGTANDIALAEFLWNSGILLEVEGGTDKEVCLRKEELTVLELRAANLSVKSAGERIGISRGVAQNLLWSVTRKFEARNPTHAFALYLTQQTRG